jgi:hypothetical protein
MPDGGFLPQSGQGRRNSTFIREYSATQLEQVLRKAPMPRIEDFGANLFELEGEFFRATIDQAAYL